MIGLLTFIQLRIIQENAGRIVHIKPDQVGILPYHIVVVGIVRDIAEILKLNIERVMNILPMFKEYSVFIYENDSNDGTQQVLEEAQQKYGVHRFKYTSQTKIDSHLAIEYQGKGRFERMAKFRNEYVQELRKPEYDQVDYVMVLDWDLRGMFNDQHMYKLFHNTKPPPFDAMFAHVQNRYPVARNPISSVYSFNEGYDTLALVLLNGKGGKQVRLILYEYDEPCHVRSAFNGMGIYRKVIFDTLEYRGDKCEHICFHEDMWKQGYTQTYIIPYIAFCHEVYSTPWGWNG
jgi:hypothetical protein